MRLVGAEDIDVAALKALHTGACNEGAFAFYDPGNLCFVVAVQVVVEMGQYVFLHHNAMFLRNGNGELYNFHVQLDLVEMVWIFNGAGTANALTNITKFLLNKERTG